MNPNDANDLSSRLFEFALWIIELDNDDPNSPGRKERQTITLNKIIKRAEEALGD